MIGPRRYEEYARSSTAIERGAALTSRVFRCILCMTIFLANWAISFLVIGRIESPSWDWGGYGRKEMSPYSDIDLLFLKSDDAPEGVYRGIRSVLYLLWDARVEFGHSVRTVSECCKEAEKDLAVLTSMLDLRLVWGSCELLKELLIQIKRLVNDADPFDLYFRIESEILNSSDKFGQTIYLLEPHLKEGPGSLRYIQLITWLGSLIFGCATLEDLATAGICKRQEVEQVRRDAAFLSKLRNGLHFYSGRRDDRLRFEPQAVLAQELGILRRGRTTSRRGVYG